MKRQPLRGDLFPHQTLAGDLHPFVVLSDVLSDVESRFGIVGHVRRSDADARELVVKVFVIVEREVDNARDLIVYDEIARQRVARWSGGVAAPYTNTKYMTSE